MYSMVILTLKQGNLIMYQPSYQGMYECFWHNTLSPHKELEVVIYLTPPSLVVGCTMTKENFSGIAMAFAPETITIALRKILPAFGTVKKNLSLIAHAGLLL